MFNADIKQKIINNKEKLLLLERNKREELRQEAYNKAKEAAFWAKSNYVVNNIYLFGSTVKGVFRFGSDIDIAIEGLENEQNFDQLYEEMSDIVDPFKLDLLLLEEAGHSLQGRILSEGELI